MLSHPNSTRLHLSQCLTSQLTHETEHSQRNGLLFGYAGMPFVFCLQKLLGYKLDVLYNTGLPE